MANLKDTTINGSLLINSNGTDYNIVDEILALKEKMNSTPQYGHYEKLWSGTLEKSGTVTINENWKKYIFFMCRTSDGATMCFGCREAQTSGTLSGVLRMTGAYDDGTKSYIHKVSVTISSSNVMTLVSASKHYLGTTSIDGSVLNMTALYGIM